MASSFAFIFALLFVSVSAAPQAAPERGRGRGGRGTTVTCPAGSEKLDVAFGRHLREIFQLKTIDDCRVSCLNLKTCKTFRFDSTTKKCDLYDQDMSAPPQHPAEHQIYCKIKRQKEKDEKKEEEKKKSEEEEKGEEKEEEKEDGARQEVFDAYDLDGNKILSLLELQPLFDTVTQTVPPEAKIPIDTITNLFTKTVHLDYNSFVRLVTGEGAGKGEDSLFSLYALNQRLISKNKIKTGVLEIRKQDELFNDWAPKSELNSDGFFHFVNAVAGVSFFEYQNSKTLLDKLLGHADKWGRQHFIGVVVDRDTLASELVLWIPVKNKLFTISSYKLETWKCSNSNGSRSCATDTSNEVKSRTLVFDDDELTNLKKTHNDGAQQTYTMSTKITSSALFDEDRTDAEDVILSALVGFSTKYTNTAFFVAKTSSSGFY